MQKTDHEYPTRQKVSSLNDKVRRIEGRILDLEKVQKHLRETLESMTNEARQNNQVVQERLQVLIDKLSQN